MSLLKQTWTKKAQQLVAPHVSFWHRFILCVDPQTANLCLHFLSFVSLPVTESSRFGFGSYWELTGKLVKGTEV